MAVGDYFWNVIYLYIIIKKKKKTANKQKLQHPDFARGPPPHYYPGQNVLNFADQTGCGALTIVWP